MLVQALDNLLAVEQPDRDGDHLAAADGEGSSLRPSAERAGPRPRMRATSSRLGCTQGTVGDVVHVGPELETAGGAFRRIAKRAEARGRATDAAMSVAKAGPTGGASAWGYAGPISGPPRAYTGRGHFFC